MQSGQASQIRQHGFTLIELMIVVAIIGILSAAAIFVYQDHLAKARVSEALLQGSVAKLAVVDNAMSGSANLSAGFVPPSATRNLNSVLINSNNGVITMTVSAAAGGGTLVLIPYTGTMAAPVMLSVGSIPDSIVRWRCRAENAVFPVGPVGTMRASLAPGDCR